MSDMLRSDQLESLKEQLKRLFAMLYILPARIRDNDHVGVIETELRLARLAASPGVLQLLNMELVTELRQRQLDEHTPFGILRIYTILRPGLLRSSGLSSFLNSPAGTPASPSAFISAYAFKYGSALCVVDAARGPFVPVDETSEYIESDSQVSSISLPYLQRMVQALGIDYRAAQESGNTLLYANDRDPTRLGLSIPRWDYRYYLSASGSSAKSWPSFHSLLWDCLRNRKY